MKNANIIIGLGFGDEGKGNFTDYLCSKSSNPIVVRFSGGQQVGHTVIRNNIKHVFSNFGSGTLQNIPTYYTEDTSIYLSSMDIEKKILTDLNINPIVYVNPLTKLTTPFDIAYGQSRELKLKHGSCGLGIGSTMNRNINTGYKLYAIDLTNNIILKEKLNMINTYYRDLSCKNGFLDTYLDILDKHYDNFFKLIDIYENYIKIKNYDLLNQFDDIIFEGSQGILLDMDHGVFPNVTYSNTTSKNAIKICKKLNIIPNIYYITRCYQTRHGNGWVSNYNKVNLINNEEEINVENIWQGKFKIFELDYDILKYSLSIDNIYHEDNYDKNIVVTCLDQISSFNFDYSKLDIKFKNIYNSYSPVSDNIKIL